jgi:hypothetical protein
MATPAQTLASSRLVLTAAGQAPYKVLCAAFRSEVQPQTELDLYHFDQLIRSAKYKHYCGK